MQKEKLTSSEEDHLKAIFKLSGAMQKHVSTNAIAEVLHTKASSVTDMLQKLAAKKYIHYKKYQGVTLSKKGRIYAASIVRKHRLWEVFLVEKLGFKWDEIHQIAEQLEHIESTALTDKLDRFLGNPKYDPHGDPIPDKNGSIKHHKDNTISDMKLNQKAVIVGVKEHSVEFLQYLESVRLILGTEVQLLKRFDYDQSVIVAVDGNKLMVSDQVSQKLLVKDKPKLILGS